MAKLFLSLLSLFFLCTSISTARKTSDCQISRINAVKPADSLQAEAGMTELWDYRRTEFRCAGVSLQRHTIKRGGLMLPVYHNDPVLAYAVQGKGIVGILNPGCPETFKPSNQSEDQHQRIDTFNAGDVIAFPTGAAHWVYNNGDQDLIVVALHDTSNDANQLDSTAPRSFQLAGNGPLFDFNIFRGFKLETLSEAFSIDEEIAKRIQAPRDGRGHIVAVPEGISPPREQTNGVEETLCSAKVRENIDNATRAEIHNPSAGWLTTVNRLKSPILGLLRLSAARGVLYKNAIMAPLWFLNAHSIVYVTRGESRMQIVANGGKSVFDGQVKEGQVVVVPQNFVVLKKAGEQGFDWVEFNTNDNAMMNTLSGRASALTGMPADVIAASYQIPLELANQLKSARSETLFFSPAVRH